MPQHAAACRSTLPELGGTIGACLVPCVVQVLGALHRGLRVLRGVPGVLHRALGVLHRVLGVLRRVLGVLPRALGVLHKVLHRVLGVQHRAVGVLHRVLGGTTQGTRGAHKPTDLSPLEGSRAAAASAAGPCGSYPAPDHCPPRRRCGAAAMPVSPARRCTAASEPGGL